MSKIDSSFWDELELIVNQLALEVTVEFTKDINLQGKLSEAAATADKITPTEPVAASAALTSNAESQVQIEGLSDFSDESIKYDRLYPLQEGEYHRKKKQKKVKKGKKKKKHRSREILLTPVRAYSPGYENIIFYRRSNKTYKKPKTTGDKEKCTEPISDDENVYDYLHVGEGKRISRKKHSSLRSDDEQVQDKLVVQRESPVPSAESDKIRRRAPKSKTNYRTYHTKSDDVYGEKSRSRSPPFKRRRQLSSLNKEYVDDVSDDDLEIDYLGPVNEMKIPFSKAEIMTEQDKSMILSSVKDCLVTGKTPADDVKTLLNDYQTLRVTSDGVLYRELEGRNVTWIPEKQVNAVIESLHVLQFDVHLSFGRTMKAIEEKYFWPCMFRTVQNYLANCEQCSRKMKKTSVEPAIIEPEEGEYESDISIL